MHFGIFKLTARHRYILAITFTALNFIQVLLGMLMTGGSIYIVITVSPKFYSEKAEITFVFTVTGMFGTHVMITYLVGIKIGDKCYNLAHKKSTGRHLIVWTMGSFNTTLNIFVIALLASKISKHIIRSLRHSLEKGMHNYLKDNNWKHVLDKWQFKLQCCGIDSYKDWYKITWLDKYHVNVDNAMVKELRSSTEFLHLPVLPWSCCRNDFPMQCFHDPLQQLNSKHLWSEQPNIIADSINNQGCLSVMRYPIEVILSYFILFSIILVILQIIIIILSRLLYTSCKNAIILGDPDGIAPGWIFTRGFFSKKGDRTLSEILIDLGVSRSDIARYQAFDPQLPLEDSHRYSNTNSPTSSRNERISSAQMAKKLASVRSKSVGDKASSSMMDNVKKSSSKSEPTSDGDPISSADEEALLLK